MDGVPILSLMLLVPLVGGLACFFLEAKAARVVALAATLLGFVAFAAAWRHFFNRGPLEAALAATSRTLAPGPARTQKDKD